MEWKEAASWLRSPVKLKLKEILGNLLLVALIMILASRTMAFAAGEDIATPVSVISSESMEPTLDVGDMVFWVPTPIGSVSEGDIVVFRSTAHGGEVVSHRVVEVREDEELITQGDANEHPDPNPVTEDDLLGRVVSFGDLPFRIPLIGHFWLSMTASFGAIVAGIGGRGMLMSIPMLTAGAMIIVLIMMLPEKKEESDLVSLVLGKKEDKVHALKVFLLLLIAFSLVILPTVLYGSETHTISIGVHQEAEPADETFSRVRPGQVIHGNQSINNYGLLSTHMFLDARGEAEDWITFDENYRNLEGRSQDRVPFTIEVPEDASEGQYTAVVHHQHSSFWSLYPEGFVVGVLSSYPSYGALYMALLTVLIFTSLSIAFMLLLSFVIDELMLWKDYRKAKREISGEKVRRFGRVKRLTDWLVGIDRIEFEPDLPIKASLISFIAFPLALIGVNLWLLPITVITAVLLTLYLGGKWRGEIHSAALLAGGITIVGTYLFPLLIGFPGTFLDGVPLMLIASALCIIILVFLSPLILSLSHLTALITKKFSKEWPEISDI